MGATSLHNKVLILALVFISVGILGGVLRAVLYSSMLPNCWRCGASNVRRSLYPSLANGPLKILYLVPYRCGSCLWRFYAIKKDLHDHLVPSAGHVISTESRGHLSRHG
jgi:hypothetical protein